MHNNEKKGKNLEFSRILGTFLPVLFWITLTIGFEEIDMAISTICAALLHELGHICFLLIVKRKKYHVRNVLTGFRIASSEIMSYREEMSLYISGPMANLLCATLSFILRPLFGEYALGFAIINLATALSNLMPISGYDGYGILRCLCESSPNAHGLIRALDVISSMLIFTLCIFSLYLIDRAGGGYWIFAVFFVLMIKDFRKHLGA